MRPTTSITLVLGTIISIIKHACKGEKFNLKHQTYDTYITHVHIVT